MDSIDLSRGKQATLQDAVVLENLPSELIELIRLGDGSVFLGAIAAVAIIPALTLRFFARFENSFADTCARWITEERYERHQVIEAFARILRFAPHLAAYLQKLPATSHPSNHDRIPKDLTFHYLSEDSQDIFRDLSDLQLQRLLLAALRLLSFEKRTFAPTISASKIQALIRHSNRAVRYLAVKVLCHLLSASDAKLEEMIIEHVGKEEAVMGDFDGHLIDYGFLSLYEGNAAYDVEKMRKAHREFTPEPESYTFNLRFELVSPWTCFKGILLPRPNGKPTRPSTLVPTSTTSNNIKNFAKALLSRSPILVHGLAGSGKTLLVNDFARELGKDSTMVTLHLNEQTDAKMLIGMYTTDSTPGSFTWRPGVLTTAIREGRWVFIEDLDRAPNEVISVVLPLIEREELLIPSRGEIIKAAPGFRLIASIRTLVNMSGREMPPSMHMLGARLWNRVPVRVPDRDEFMGIINGIHPILHKFLPGIIAVYEHLYTLSQKPTFASKSRGSVGRPISPRDLLKWCRRLNAVLVAAGSKTGDEPITEAAKDEMFMEAADCFAGSLQSEDARKLAIFCIAEEMHIPPQRVEHYLNSHLPNYNESETHLQIGRVKILKRKASNRITKTSKRPRPFANTAHAKRLLEQVGVALKMAEPVLLVGETGIGKTAVIQQLADSLGYKLTTINLSQQSEIGDLLGGFKPVNARSLAIPLKEEFDDLFAATGISASRNQKYLEQLGKSIAKGQWSKASKLWHEAPRMFDRILSDIMNSDTSKFRGANEQPTKRRKTDSKLHTLLELKPRWEKFSHSLDQFDVQLSGGQKGFAFTFVEGNIVKAARNGDWVLLDEINLASPDTLESIADLLLSGPSGSPSILLSETGEIERIQAHPDFRVFGAMNPATDVGKKDLPMGLRSRFTEIYVESPDRDLNDLLFVVKAYLKGVSSNDERAAHDSACLYMDTKRLADEKRLVDGANQIPHFSLRTLTRVLGYATEIAPSYGLRRALYEGFAMGFLTLLNGESERMLVPLINHHLLDSHGNPQALLAQTPRHPADGRKYVRFMNKKRDRQYWMLQGRETPQEQSHYIITPFVERNMLNLVRATSTRRFPVLVQGPTSSGKTSMIEYLAKFSGNKFVRINNHEHTDLQEYLGTYVSGSDGQLLFQEGLLVQALREGHWIVLDELNLAPSDVLEALNRLLDDNRELLIPETQEVVRPHDNFMLFATQNPPGLYGGRKTLSRAFRNRFLELHFDDIPEDELQFILENRSQKVAPSDCRRIVTVYKELSRLRQSSRLFEQKDSFATLRDLFRWALRDADNREQLAANGYMLLAERVRKPEERTAVKEVIERVMKVRIDPVILYDGASSSEIQLYNGTSNMQGVVWTNAMRRLFVLVAHALRNNEPVLLVGETGCGKTTVCQMLAEAFGKQLHIVNAHQNTETGDLIGAQRPIRNRAAMFKQLEDDLRVALQARNGQEQNSSYELESLLAAYNGMDGEARAALPKELRQRIRIAQLRVNALFEWTDGSLVQAMKDAQFFLLDEISLADDSVLERLNSVLESGRTLLLAEKGVEDSFVQAANGFQFFATMNPGGDYGKRELSPALRNRFTEIWVPSLSDHEDVLQIVEAKLAAGMKYFAKAMVSFAEWFGRRYRSSSTQSISVRDVLAWITFINGCSTSDPYFAVLHGAAMIYIDTLGANPAALIAINPEDIAEERGRCLQQLSMFLNHDMTAIYAAPVNFKSTAQVLSFGDFSIEKTAEADTNSSFAFEAPTTKLNAMRIVRALQLQKPILIEGSPGVGKTTLIAALAIAVGKHLTRINLSEQTDLMDLFGSDVPVEGSEAGNFEWRDAPFLQAMQSGGWVLLDEMNLASQSVLEGLNACLDHRGSVYISELDQTFRRHPEFSVFAAQNPHHQGSGRKGLPTSFVNRFTVVYADVFRYDDLTLICRHNFSAMSDEVMSNVVTFVSTLEQEVVHKRRFGSQGAPWEFNLRDSLRWLQLLASSDPFLAACRPADFLNIIFRQRFRTAKDRQEVDKIFSQVFGVEVPFRHYFHNLSIDGYQIGMTFTSRHTPVQRLPFPAADMITRLPELESIMMCVKQGLPCILVGPSGSGKTALIQHVAAASGAPLVVFSLNSDIDTMDLVGGYEQIDPQRGFSAFLKELCLFLETCIFAAMPEAVASEAIELLCLCQSVQEISSQHLKKLHQYLVALHSKTSLPEIGQFILACQQLMDYPNRIESARFEWVDGILIKALEEGEWLVLDNANLCSSSVLDRLNSLLEPNGFLSINEHCGRDGKIRVVKPHPHFRLFLTMDPRFGELSRAMRNRAIEIYIDDLIDHENSRAIGKSHSPPAEASLQRYGKIMEALQARHPHDQRSHVVGVALDHLSQGDMSLLPRFAEALKDGLISVLNSETSQLFRRYLEILRSRNGESFREAVDLMYMVLGRSIHLPQGFKDAQTVQPLQNSPLVPLLCRSSGSDQSYWLGALLEFNLDVLASRDALHAEALALTTLKPSQMNRLQRSMARDRVPAVAKDSTVGVAKFLVETLDVLDEHFRESVFVTEDWRDHKKALASLMRFWWQTYRLTSSPNFEDSAFQAHLSIGRDILSNLAKRMRARNDYAIEVQAASEVKATPQNIVNLFQLKLREYFDTGFQLTTGLSMEKLWLYFRPKPISEIQTLCILIDMEDLAARFDKLRWRTSMSLVELSRIMTSLVKAYNLILTSPVDGSSLVQTLGSELASLESGTPTEVADVAPFFSAQFEALRQYEALQKQPTNHDIMVLAGHATKSLMHLASASKTSINLQGIDYLWGRGEGLSPVQDSFSASLLHKLQRVEDVNLGSLSLLDAELPILGLHTAQTSALLCRNQVLDMNNDLYQLIMETIEVHGDSTFGEIEEWAQNMEKINDASAFQLTSTGIGYKMYELQKVNSLDASNPYHLQRVLQDHLKPALIAIVAAKAQPENQMKYSALAWIHFAMGCIALYIPDRPFDPNSRQRLECQQHDNRRQSLQDKIEALRQYENMFTGQNTNLRCQLLEEDLLEIGEPAKAMQEVIRPEKSELDQLQGEFNNLLGIALRAKPQKVVLSHFLSGLENTVQEIKLLQHNVTQIIHRLSERFRAYGDMTVPVICMLRCLQIGLYMADLVSVDVSPSRTIILALSKITPFLGGEPLQSEAAIPILGHSFDLLDYNAMLSSVEGLAAFSDGRQRSLLHAFHSFYEQWRDRLDADRKEEESRSGLYRFRGSAEDQEDDDQEEFDELFPAYDEEESHRVKSASATVSARDTAVALANIHAKIFVRDGTPAESIISLLRQISGRVSTLYKEDIAFANGGMTGALLPGALLLLNDQIRALSLTLTTSDSYNFYTDANLPEARNLVGLVHQIQSRFLELQAVDEISHMQPLEDVLVSCKELLKFQHTEPIAKVITKVEKVHNFMHEWQFGGWASRANSAVTLYDNLTATIVRWRRLELSTWARLLDMESKKCDDDAKAWWFIAYEVVIAAPLSMAQSASELRAYTQKLLQDLETYFATAIQGQFRQRLNLLKQLQRHLQLLVLKFPLISIVLKAVANFTEIYTRYEKPVGENLQKGRQVLEKAMRDVLLLASWKDTNIVALRDSARRSHHKLFKVVRKYRALLGQPMELVLKQGLPDETEDISNDIALVSQTILPSVDTAALTVCQSHIPHWSGKSKRFINVSKTVGLMDEACKIPEFAAEWSQYLESFLTNVITSTADLRKATPAILTEENKDVVKHLKSRKRKLFADTLKELRQMGIMHNLSTDVLSNQQSLSAILSRTENLKSSCILISESLEYYYHKVLDSIPRARAATRQHSEDLSSAEVARGAGLLEGLLQVVLKQRNVFSVSIALFDRLGQLIKKAQALWAPGKYEIKKLVAHSTHDVALKWLPNILRVGLELVKVHGSLGQIDSTDLQNKLSLWVKTFDLLARNWQYLPVLPVSISSTDREDLKQKIDDSIQNLRTDLTTMSKQHPNVAFILQQIGPWVVTRSESVTSISCDQEISALDQKLSRTCDSILVAIEKLTKSMAKFPSSTDESAWLIKYEACLVENIASLHCTEITRQIGQAFEILKALDLDHENMGKATGAVFAVALPVFEQYSNILRKSLGRYAKFHRTTCKMAYILTKTFIQVASQGFCTPSEKSNAQDGETEKLEGGTGLGDGEGAEDISKDIQDDEDLSELAQEPAKGEQEGIEDEKDAVDMADGDVEGEMGDAEEKGGDEKGSGDEEEEEDEIEEEAGDVDDLDPNAVDEKMWDGEGEKAEKHQEGDQSKGKTIKNEQVAAQENGNQDPDDGECEEEEQVGAEQGEDVMQEEAETHDSHAKEGEVLELPENMELDGDNQEDSVSGSEDGMDDLSDINETTDKDERVDENNDTISENEDVQAQNAQDIRSILDTADPDNWEDNQGEDAEEVGAEGEEELEPETEDQDGLRDHSNDGNVESDNAAPNEAKGTGEDQNDNQPDDETALMSKAQRDEGGKSGDSPEQTEASAEDGEKGRQVNSNVPQNQNDETQDNTEAQPFKKLGDALERWYRQQTKIRGAPEQQDKTQEQAMEVGENSAEFQHLQDEDAEADAQALGTAAEDQAHVLDESMAIETESHELPETFQPEETEPGNSDGNNDMDIEPQGEKQDLEPTKAYEGRAGAMIRQANADREPESNDLLSQESADVEEEIEEVDVQLSSTHIDDVNAFAISRSASDARQLWTHYESLTRDLSLCLTEQLRLILAPTLATKMRGDFRTGKRLNIKRIIPYIASQYKRDKIWMRRSVPSKRRYQIMLAVDDSKSMGESGSGSLAFETLTMVSRSLSMLEVGEICFVAFGENVKVAHDFDTPFSSEAGPKIFQNFGFGQSRTDVTKLVTESIELFRAARAKASSSPSELWQLELIISDGVCDSSEHEPIRRLLREAIEERIMMVFVIVDDVKNKKKGESVMDLKEAKFVKDEVTGVSNVKIERYLDTFPFQYYLIVSDVKELPGVLATLLRQWFAEVADSTG